MVERQNSSKFQGDIKFLKFVMVHYPSTVYHFLLSQIKKVCYIMSSFLGYLYITDVHFRIHLDMNNILQMIQENFLTCNVYYVKLNKYKNNFYIIDRKIRFCFRINVWENLKLQLYIHFHIFTNFPKIKYFPKKVFFGWFRLDFRVEGTDLLHFWKTP